MPKVTRTEERQGTALAIRKSTYLVEYNQQRENWTTIGSITSKVAILSPTAKARYCIWINQQTKADKIFAITVLNELKAHFNSLAESSDRNVDTCKFIGRKGGSAILALSATAWATKLFAASAITPIALTPSATVISTLAGGIAMFLVGEVAWRWLSATASDFRRAAGSYDQIVSSIEFAESKK